MEVKNHSFIVARGLICSSGSPDPEQASPLERSAGACPPRCQVSEAGFAGLTRFAGLGLPCGCNASFHRSAGACPPRSRNQTKNVRSLEAPDVFFTIAAWRGTGPRPTVNGDDFLFFTVARGPVPRDLSQNEKRPQPRDHGRFLLRPVHGEGQALALRYRRRA